MTRATRRHVLIAAAAALPLRARAQAPRRPLIACLGGARSDASNLRTLADPLVQGLRELVVSQKAARAIGVRMPPSVLVSADEVVE